jgi:hypothetical protein
MPLGTAEEYLFGIVKLVIWNFHDMDIDLVAGHDVKNQRQKTDDI